MAGHTAWAGAFRIKEVRRRSDGRSFPAKRVVRNNALVKTFQALWCEMDRGTIWEQWQRLRSFGVFPTMVVWSGGKSLQAYWVLAEARKDNAFVEPYLIHRPLNG